MGEFTQSLLKLTEFPFSYSFLGLLALIFGHGINLEKLSFTEIGPLLILMGFVATTLSICDPVGAIQRLIIKGRPIIAGKEIPYGQQWWISKTIESEYGGGSPAAWKPILEESQKRLSEQQKFHSASEFIYVRIFRKLIGSHFPLPYIFAIAYSPEGIKRKRYAIDWDLIQRLVRHIAEGSKKIFLEDPVYELNKVSKDDFDRIAWLLERLKQQAVKTKWITAEVDRITALIYFIAVISLFIGATIQLNPDFLRKFAQVFGNNESTKLGILIFSIGALIAVSIMFIIRIRGLRDKASTVFKYLTARGAIKTDNFRSAFEEIERYLDDNNWILAEYLVSHIQIEYTEFFVEKVKEGPVGGKT